jgi:hypothetical protein
VGSQETAAAVLAGTLAKCRAALAAGERVIPGGEALIDELLAGLEAAGDEVELADRLESFAGPNGERREALADVVSLIVRELADGDGPPPRTGARELWRQLVILTDRLFGSGVAPLGRLPFVSDRLIELLGEEAGGAARREDRAGEAGRFLANLAVSRKLRSAVADAVGFPVEPTYRAVYLYDIPGSHVKTHVDTRDYEVVFHLVLDHAVPDGEEGSALVVHRVGEAEPHRVRVRPGEALALRGRGTIHSWEPMRPMEHRTLVAIGFERADDR